MTANLTQLRDRVLALTGPDREVDLELLNLLWSERGAKYRWSSSPFLQDRDGSQQKELAVLWWPDEANITGASLDARMAYAESLGVPSVVVPPRYTASVDAALALCERVLPGPYHITLVLDPSGCGCEITHWPGGLSGGRELTNGGLATTGPAAILLALLHSQSQG